MASSAATPDRGSGMAHLQASHAAAAGKRRGNKALHHATDTVGVVARRAIFAVLTLFVWAVSGWASHAQSGPFAGMGGVWSGDRTVTLEDGSSERIRCRATYAVGDGGAGLNLDLTCASDSYRFELRGNVISNRGALSGTWTEGTRGNGHPRGARRQRQFSSGSKLARLHGEPFVVDFCGNRQSIAIRAEGAFRGASISLSRR